MSNKILIATFSVWDNNHRTAISGMVEPLLSYLLPRYKQVDLIDGLHPGSSSVLSKIEHYRDGSLKHTTTSLASRLLFPLLWLQNKSATQIVFKVRDFLTVLEWGIKSIYALAGILLRTFGIVKVVVYYVSDYSPRRYSQKWFNNLYVFLDKLCAKHANYIWDVSPAMQSGRKEAGLDLKESAPVIIVPNALFPKQISHSAYNTLIPHSLIFAGTLGLENGPDLAIKAVAKLVKQYPDITLHIFGGNEGGKETFLKQMSKELGIEQQVFFHGFVHNAEELSRKINRYMIGLAPYKRKKDSVRAYGDATKLRLYMGAGIPTITTAVPPLGKEIEKKGAALIVEDNENSLASAIIKLFNKNLHQKMREEAVKFGKNNTWENTYGNALSQMGEI